MSKQVEYVVWGVPSDKKDDPINEVPLFTLDPNTRDYITDKKVADALVLIAKKKGAKSVRIAEMDMTKQPDFTKTINQKRRK